MTSKLNHKVTKVYGRFWNFHLRTTTLDPKSTTIYWYVTWKMLIFGQKIIEVAITNDNSKFTQNQLTMISVLNSILYDDISKSFVYCYPIASKSNLYLTKNQFHVWSITISIGGTGEN